VAVAVLGVDMVGGLGPGGVRGLGRRWNAGERLYRVEKVAVPRAKAVRCKRRGAAGSSLRFTAPCRQQALRWGRAAVIVGAAEGGSGDDAQAAAARGRMRRAGVEMAGETSVVHSQEEWRSLDMDMAERGESSAC
jgi:hypothetical protein